VPEREQMKIILERGCFLLLCGENKLLCFRVGIEKIFNSSEEFIPKYLKRYTVPVREDTLPTEHF